ncbi:CaiB/BaiF CoA-transferase family protein [Mycolicibacterium palauense]|uniref:CaiB/BaiF CoA-transferase family protein n=1 Tax=Mycolicibacterium palauense TaxID=2034511 RepID=UPI001FECF984|nr:CoA transferase [Mycolicibacterium palauense]
MEEPNRGAELPLRGVRVLDLADPDADLITRAWADLGADVLKVEISGRSPAPGPPFADVVSLPFALHNANKRATALDPRSEGDRNRLLDLIAGADIVVDSGDPGNVAAFALSCAHLVTSYPHLVAMSVTDFGRSGPKSDWRATDAVYYALSTALTRSRRRDGRPVLPPTGIATATAAAQAAWAGLAAYHRRLRCGRGDYIDFSRYEAVLQALDPPFGSQGQAAAARRLGGPPRRGSRRPDPYPVFACADGWVRICVLAPRQWRGLRAWLGEPEQFQDPAYDAIGARFAVFDEIGRLVSTKFADRTMDELVNEGLTFGVPIAAVATPEEVLHNEHFRATGALADLDLDPATTVTAPDGCTVVDGVRTGVRHMMPAAEAGQARWAATRPDQPVAGRGDGVSRPFEGLRILDLGVIVAGGELGRLFSDLGAEVIKVESPAYPDGLRQTRAGQAISESFAWTHRNQLSIGLNLRDRAGARLFGRLVAESDMVLANFKPGTLASLGFSYPRLRALNPKIVLAESSAYGDGGPWRTHLGYGPLVRASTGITRLWTDRERSGDVAFCDSTTVFPDHVVARVAATAALAVLIRRERTGLGGHVHVSQAEVAINQLDVVYAAESARLSGIPVRDDEGVHLVVAGSGDDDWGVVSVRDDADWRALASVLSAPELLADPRWRTQHDRWVSRIELPDVLAHWTTRHCWRSLAEELQCAGVPAAPMNRAGDVLDDPHLRARNLYTDMVHPLLESPLPTETAAAGFGGIAPARLSPAPMPGEQTREVCRRLLGLPDPEIDQLVADGALFEDPLPTSTAGSQL